MMTIYDKFGLFVGGAWADSSSGEIPVYSPVTERVLGKVPTADIALTQRVISDAQAAFFVWSKTPVWERATRLHKVADEMSSRSEEAARMIVLETGKPITQAQREWSLAVDQFRWYAEEARRVYGRIVETRVPNGEFSITREPVGVVAAFTAWNFPAALVARKVAPALAAGCSVILRPSNQTPGVSMVLFDCLHSADLPSGTVNLLVGAAQDIYSPIMESSVVRKVSLTGSTKVGQQMIRDSARTLKKVSMELGGNAPMILFEDGDINAALDGCVAAKFANAGQVCVTPDRFFIHEQHYKEFVEGFVDSATKLRLGDGLDPATDMGPLINEQRRTDISIKVAQALDSGAHLECGGGPAEEFDTGYFYKPTVLTNVSDEMLVMAEENFGPIAAITSFSNEDSVIERANSSPMGLSAYAFTSDPARVRRIQSNLKAGMVGVNSFALAAAEVPFGGTKYSGMGREGGIEGLSGYLDTKLTQWVM
jgi:succinate-semialdehyde dehydrogenase/glutarate-semialdehyde dehydrogenase